MAAKAREERLAKARTEVGLSNKDCITIQIECEDRCKKTMTDRNSSILKSSDRSRCKRHCSLALVYCMHGDRRNIKVELCKANCEVFIDSNGGAFRSSDRSKCFRKCDKIY